MSFRRPPTTFRNRLVRFWITREKILTINRESSRRCNFVRYFVFNEPLIISLNFHQYERKSTFFILLWIIVFLIEKRLQIIGYFLIFDQPDHLSEKQCYTLIVEYYLYLIAVVAGDSSGMSETEEISHRRVSDGDSSLLTPRRTKRCWSRRHCHTMWRS